MAQVSLRYRGICTNTSLSSTQPIFYFVVPYNISLFSFLFLLVIFNESLLLCGVMGLFGIPPIRPHRRCFCAPSSCGYSLLLEAPDDFVLLVEGIPRAICTKRHLQAWLLTYFEGMTKKWSSVLRVRSFS